LVSTSRGDASGEVDAVLARATASEPDDQFSSIGDLVAAVQKALGTAEAEVVTPPPLAAETRNPYKGLRPFFERDAEDFFGRTDLVVELLEKVDSSRLIALVGPSGSGKSSVVSAGLIPALRSGQLPGSESWFITGMFPGSYPFEEMESALMKVAVQEPTAVLDQLAADARGLMRVTRQMLPSDDSELLLVVDQFEELFILVDEEELRRRFLDSLVQAVTDPRSRMRVVLTMRADFFDRPLRYSPFSELVRDGLVPITPLTEIELAAAVERPAERVGLEFEPGLVNEIAADVSEQPGALPLLQYALTELYERRQDGKLTLEGYRSTGGVLGALGRRAEEIYQELDRPGQEACRQLFLRLVDVGDVTDTRRRITRAEVRGLEVDQKAISDVVGQFGTYRLILFDRDPVSRVPTVEIAHDALFREWARLRDWIESRHDDLRQHRRLAAATREWVDADREASYLLRGGRLEQSETWTAETDLSLTANERGYLGESRLQEDGRRQRRRRRQGAATAVLAAAAVLGVVLALFAFGQRRAAEERALVASARELAGAALANLEVDAERSLLLALEAVRTTYDVDGTVVREAEEALHAALQASRLELTLPDSGRGAFSPDGRLFAAADPILFETGFGRRFQPLVSRKADGRVTIWDARSGSVIGELPGHPGGVIDLAFISGGSLLATTGEDARVRVWEVDRGGEIWDQGLIEPITLAVSPDGSLVGATSAFGFVKIWDAATGREVALLLPRSQTAATDLVFSDDGTRLAVSLSDGRAWIYDTSTWEPSLVLEAHPDSTWTVALDPTGRLLITGGADATAKIWDTTTGELLGTLRGHTADVNSVDFSPNGRWVATASSDGSARIWDASTREVLIEVAAGGPTDNVTFSPDGSRIATAHADGTAKIWNVSAQGSGELLTLSLPSSVGSVAFGAPGRIATRGLDDGTVRVWDVSSGTEVLSLPGPRQGGRATFSPDGTLLGAPGPDYSAVIWSAATGDVRYTLEDAGVPFGGRTPPSPTARNDPADVWSVAFSHDGQWLATGNSDGALKFWDAATGTERPVLGRPVFGPSSAVTLSGFHLIGPVYSLVFSPDDQLLLSAAEDGSARLWEVPTGRLRQRFEHGKAVFAASFSPGGERVATASEDGTAVIWDALSGEQLIILSVGGLGFSDVEFSPDGARIATGSIDGTVTLWDAATGAELLTLTGHRGPVTDLDFSDDGLLLASSSTDGTVQVLVLDTGQLIDLAESRVTRPLTDFECRRYLHTDGCLLTP
jgi:WD40 repeat protein